MEAADEVGMPWYVPPQAWHSHPQFDRNFLPRFKKYLHTANKPLSVLELGTRRSNPDAPTIHRSWAPDDCEYIGTDFMDGLDVDVVSDAHTMSQVFGENRFDAVISDSTFEHIERPWIAAREVAKILKPGGVMFCSVPFAFPQHGYPNDYWRFTPDALRVLFEDAGLETIAAHFSTPCRVVSEHDPNMQGIETFSQSRILSRKPQS